MKLQQVPFVKIHVQYEVKDYLPFLRQTGRGFFWRYSSLRNETNPFLQRRQAFRPKPGLEYRQLTCSLHSTALLAGAGEEGTNQPLALEAWPTPLSPTHAIVTYPSTGFRWSLAEEGDSTQGGWGWRRRRKGWYSEEVRERDRLTCFTVFKGLTLPACLPWELGRHRKQRNADLMKAEACLDFHYRPCALAVFAANSFRENRIGVIWTVLKWILSVIITSNYSLLSW